MNFINLWLGRRGTPAFLLVTALPVMVLGGSELPGVGNFEKVDEHVYRGAQPTEQGFQNLAKLGIRIVIDLRESDARSLAEAETVKATGMQYVGVPMKGMQTPSNESVTKALAMLEDPGTGPVFVHCRRGADRTGGVIACYRIEHDHWNSNRALAEAKSMGMGRFEWAIRRYVQNYQPKVINAGPLTASQ